MQERADELAGKHARLVYVERLERGLRIPRLDTLAKICSSLDVEPAELMAGMVWRPPPLTLGSFEPPREEPG